MLDKFARQLLRELQRDARQTMQQLAERVGLSTTPCWRRLKEWAESGVFLAADGEPVQTDLTERMIGINAEQMRAIPEVITIAYGTAKIPAAHAALRSGLITGLVTHTSFAHALLEPA